MKSFISTVYKSLMTVCMLLIASNVSIAQIKVAVLPFDVITNDGSIMYDAMSTEMQNQCVQFMRDDAPKAKVVDSRTVNSILTKNNINLLDMATVSPKEIAELLNVDFVLFGGANIQNKAITTTSTSSTVNRRESSEARTSTGAHDQNRSISGSAKNTKSSNSTVSTNTSKVKAEYQSRLSIDIYDKTGENVHSVSRTGMSQDLNGYLPTLRYLVKRTPFGNKYKAK
ncbi:MAG: hypothetical protein H6551_11885 [Chitinophagales bacterium]|nr:hypothetical protein [Chitinophagaceae bacterium]MCB9065829.1 hypothetical protein [Chitinophagales bacterium]